MLRAKIDKNKAAAVFGKEGDNVADRQFSDVDGGDFQFSFAQQLYLPLDFRKASHHHLHQVTAAAQIFMGYGE